MAFIFFNGDVLAYPADRKLSDIILMAMANRNIKW